MTALRARITTFYGANPLHLLILLSSFAVALYAVVLTAADSSWLVILIWFIGAVIGHDLVLFPSTLSLTAPWRRGSGLWAGKEGATPPRVSPLNYLRVPALGTGLLLLLFFPGIIRQGRSFPGSSGRAATPTWRQRDRRSSPSSAGG